MKTMRHATHIRWGTSESELPLYQLVPSKRDVHPEARSLSREEIEARLRVLYTDDAVYETVNLEFKTSDGTEVTVWVDLEDLEAAIKSVRRVVDLAQRES